MPRVHTQVARNDIYNRGKYVDDPKTKSKKRLDRSQPADSNDTIIVKKGETYYWWKFRYGGKYISTTYPKQSQLTQSDFLSRVYDIGDELGSCRETITDADGLQSFVEDITSRLEELRDETQEKLDNMPEQLQYAPTGELLQERIDGLENAISELEAIDTDYEEPDEDEIRSELADDIDEDPDAEDPDEEISEERKRELVSDDDIEEKKQEHLNEWLDEKCEELSGIELSF